MEYLKIFITDVIGIKKERKIPTHKNQLQLVKNNQSAKELFESKFPKKLLDDIYYFEKTKIFYKRLRIGQSLYYGTKNDKSQSSDWLVAVENLLSLLAPLTPKSNKVKTIVLTRFIKNLF